MCFKNPKCSGLHKIEVYFSPTLRLGIHEVAQSLPGPQRVGSALSVSLLSCVASTPKATSWPQKVASRFTLQPERREEREDAGMLSFPNDAPQPRHTPPLPGLLASALSHGQASFRRVGNIVFYSGDPMPGSTMGASIIKGEGGMGTFEDTHQCLPHSLCSIPLHTPIFT